MNLRTSKSNDDQNEKISASLLSNRKHRGGWIVLILLMIFLSWASLAPLSKGIVAPGTVVVDSKRKTIQHLEGGVIKAIHVRDGDIVKGGTILLELDDTKVKADRDLIRARYFSTLATLDRLAAAIDLEPEITFKDEVLSVIDDQMIAEALRSQQSMHRILLLEHDGKLQISNQRVVQLEEKLQGFESYKESIERQVDLLSQEVLRLEELRQVQLVESSIVSERMQQLSQQQGELSRVISNIAETKVAISEANLNGIQIEREWQQIISREITENQQSLIELYGQLEVSQSTLERAKLKAPIAGTILELKATTIGGVLTAGQPVMDIVPQDDKLILEARLRTLDVDSIYRGMKAYVKFSGFNVKTLPDLEATVEHVSADIIAGPNDVEPYYLMRISVLEDEMSKLNSREVVPGMPVEIYADAGNRTLLQYLFGPLTSLVRKSLREE